MVRFLGLSLLIAVTSGLTVWFLEQGNVDTVGASGLIFGYFGYVVVRGLFDRHLIDTLIGVVMAPPSPTCSPWPCPGHRG
ncbi:rhomboid family intramembrane serine protease [Streptomyces sp. NBC_01549]|uniref:rhomboid family intramembrane serine protease n=1 Tax=Streptomyces sp. NBC_01549 TaxID=2975874 RepID=UPI00225AC23C|nr:rhomboid family intramembrane serine protease [Streptomyces sp. NBC_01549]MCX4591311.1 rhomboid family intramembrane serine protease [Streptomyces sp. NBC_01549]